MYPRKFDYVAASTLDEALSALATNPEAKVLAGGQSLLTMMKTRLVSPPLVIDINGIQGLDRIDDAGSEIAIGALVRHRDTAASPLVVEHAPALAQAASMTGDAQVRNRGTTCGSLAHADIAADQPAAVLALGATMVAKSASGSREIPAGDFFTDALTSALAPDEILVEVRIPKGGSSAYDKLGRRGGHSDYAVAGAAAWVQKSNGTVDAARVGLTGVGVKPALAAAAAAAIVGSDGSAGAIEAAAAHATDGIAVLEDLYGTEEYKAHLAQVYVARALTAALAAG